MKTKQAQDIWTERKDQEEMKTIRKKHQGIRIGKKRKLAALKPLKCRYCPWRFFSNTQRYVSHLHNHSTRIKSCWYKNSGLHGPQAASEAVTVVQLRAICRPAYVKPNKPGVQCTENNNKFKCHFCGRYFTTVFGKTLHEKSVHLCHCCEKTFENAEMKKNHELKCSYSMDKKRNKCRFCSKYFETLQQKKRHEEYEHLTCSFCDKVFENAEVKTNHELECKCMGIKNRCRFCSRYFTTVNGRAEHEKYEHFCDLCAETFENVLDKKLHKLEYHSTDENKCRFCSKYFETLQRKKRHEEYEHLTCSFCDKVFENAEVKTNHKLECKCMGKTKCRFCSRYFTTVNGRAKHEKYEHICDLCAETFENVLDKKLHKLEYHSTDENKRRFCSQSFPTVYHKTVHEKYEHLCDICEKPFENAAVKEAHKLAVHNVNCNFCNRSFTSAHSHKCHVTYEHLCNFCDKTFENAEKKESHLLEYHGTKAGTKYIRCRFCIRCFTTAKGKLIHEAYEHICDFRSCEETFQNVEDKKLHKFECHGVEANCYRCRFCWKYFTKAIQKTIHEKCEHLCQFCEKTFKNSDGKKCHEWSHFQINYCHEFENHCTKTSGKCHDCGSNLTPADLLFYPYTQLYACLFCKKIIRLPEVKRCQKTAHNEQSSNSIKLTNQ